MEVLPTTALSLHKISAQTTIADTVDPGPRPDRERHKDW